MIFYLLVSSRKRVSRWNFKRYEDTLIPHEVQGHIVVAVENEKTLTGFSYLTSNKGGTPLGNMTNTKLSSVKIDGSFIPQQKEQKKYITDDYGNQIEYKSKVVPKVDDFGAFIPDKNKGGQ
jgi:hypothetical protein